MSSSGTALLPPRALARLRDELVPLADIVTPNLPEAETLLGRRLRSAPEIEAAARELVQLGAGAVLIKGGHARGSTICDYLVSAQSTRTFTHERQSLLARGTGCTLASAIAAGLAHGHSCATAVQNAERYLQIVLRTAFRPGKGRMHVLDHASLAAAKFTYR
jgi:hydroxymethylpyrimidine/phosphomethylpyrimidine kinase